jgi:glycosyltransferase involved in cell wall biosynthesis
MNKTLKVAIIHYWWVSNRGGESVVKSLLNLFPDADLYLHVYDRAIMMQALGDLEGRKITTTFIGQIPFSKFFYKSLLPLMPMALERLDLSEYDLVISSESGPAKGVITNPGSLNICYCHTPMRYIWDFFNQYLATLSPLKRIIFSIIAHKLRIWDVTTASRVDYFIANSKFISSRILKYYRRGSYVIPPPVDVSHFIHTRPRDNFYLVLGQLVKYKRVDIAINVFNSLNLPLVVIGEGETLGELKKLAHPNIQFLGRQPFSVVKNHLETCRALIFPGIEDFGIVPVEAMAAGAPVIAFGEGGVLDSVINNKTGCLVEEQTQEAFIEIIKKIECGGIKFDVEVLRERALKFDRLNFDNSFSSKVKELWAKKSDVNYE